MSAGPPPFAPDAAEPLISAAPPSGAPPRGVRARARTRWAVLLSHGRLVAPSGVTLGPGVRFDIAPGARIRLGADVAIGEHTRIQQHDGELLVGERVVLGDRCVIELRTDTVIGDDARLADEVVLLDHRPVTDDPDRPLRAQGIEALPIAIGSQVRIGPRAVVAAGVTIGPRAQISAYVVVEDDVPADGRVAGTPPPPRTPAPRRPRVNGGGSGRGSRPGPA